MARCGGALGCHGRHGCRRWLVLPLPGARPHVGRFSFGRPAAGADRPLVLLKRLALLELLTLRDLLALLRLLGLALLELLALGELLRWLRLMKLSLLGQRC